MLLDSFLDKKSIHEITNIFRQRVLYQLASSKDQVPDISVPQQDKINRFLNCYHVHFHDYLIGEDTYQHMDFYRILSKEIKVFNFGKGQKFRKSHYDGLYIILRGSIEETILETPVDMHQRFSPSPSKTKLLKGKKRPTDQYRMANIVNMVVGLNRLVPHSRRESLQQINEDPHQEPSSPAPYQISNFSKEQHLSTKETPIKSKYSTPDHHNNNDKQLVQSHQQHVPLKFEFNEDSKNFKELNSETSSGHSTPVIKRINSQVDQQTFTSSLGLSKHADKINGFHSQNTLADFVGELPETATGQIAQTSRFLGQNQEISSFSDLNEQYFGQSGKSFSQFSYKHGTSFSYNPIGSLSSMGSSTMLKQPFQFIDNLKRAHKIFYAGEAVNLTKVSEKDRQYSTSENEDCIYLYISKKSMQRAFHEQINQLQFKTNVLEKVFHNVPPNKILKLAYHLYERVLYKNQAVYNIGDTQPFFAYIIKSGEVQISEDINQSENYMKNLDNQENTYSESNNSNEDNSIDACDNNSDNNDSEYFIPNGIGNNAEKKQTNKKSQQFKRSGSAELQELCLKQLKRPQTARNTWKKDATLKEVLCCVGAEELFGLEELVKKKEKRYMSAIVSSSQAEFFVLPAEHFNNFYLTEADSINLWFKQKELFYDQQRNLLKRMKKGQSFTTTTQQALLKNVKKQCHHLFQEDEQTFESKLDLLQKKQLLSLTKFSEYKSYTEMQVQQGKETNANNNNSTMNTQAQQKSIQTLQTSSCQAGSTQQSSSSLYIHGLKNLSLSNLPHGDEKINSGRRSIMYSKTPQASNKGDFFRPQEHQGTGITKAIVTATTPKSLSFQQKISLGGGRTSIIDTDNKGKYPATEALHQKTERAIVSKLSLGNIQEKLRIFNALESSQDLGNLTGTPRRLGQQDSCEYISSAQSTARQQSQQGNTSQPHLGRIFNMVKDNKLIVKQQLENLGGKVNFKQPIFDELKSDNLKQALKYVHKRKQLLQGNIDSREETHEGSKTSRSSRTTSNQPRTHPSRNDQYNSLLTKMKNVQSHQESQAYQLALNLGNNSIGGGSVSSLSTSTLGLNSHHSKKTVHSGNSMQILTPNSIPILTIESPRSETPIGQHSQPQAINIHMRNKRSVERKSGPYFTRTSPGLVARHEEQKMVKNNPIIIQETNLKKKKTVVINQEQLTYYPNKTAR